MDPKRTVKYAVLDDFAFEHAQEAGECLCHLARIVKRGSLARGCSLRGSVATQHDAVFESFRQVAHDTVEARGDDPVSNHVLAINATVDRYLSDEINDAEFDAESRRVWGAIPSDTIDAVMRRICQI